MVTLSIQKPCLRAGIQNANQLARAINCSNQTAYDLWNQKTTRIDTETLSKLCQTLRCKVGDILIYRKERSSGKTKRQTRQTKER